MKNKKCIIVIPVYKSLEPIERGFLENGLVKTEGFEQVLAAPHHLNLDASFGKLQNLKVERFDDKYFESIEGYNQLMLNTGFYARFAAFEYLLIHQSDAYLFKNELNLWCDKGFDYIGAPWYRAAKLNKGAFFFWIYKKFWQPILARKRKNGWLYNKVGNGGLSLRKVKSAIEILNLCPQELLNQYLHTKSPHYNEDIFWSVEAPKIQKFKIPDWKEGLKFAVEFEPERAFKELNNELPFGCHAPLLNDEIFWRKYIPEINSVSTV